MSVSSIPLSDPRCLSLGRYSDPGEEEAICEECGEVLTEDNTRFDEDGNIVHKGCRGLCSERQADAA